MSKFIVINVLSPEVFEDCHIPGTISVPLEQLREYAKQLDKDQEIVVYCAHYECPRSKDAWHLLRSLGFTNVFAYEGGMQEWYKNGLPTVGQCSSGYLRERAHRIEDKNIKTIEINVLRKKLDLKESSTSLYSLSDFLPLIILFSVIALLTGIKQWYQGFNAHHAMTDFMGFFFLVFGGFKLLRLNAFAQAYAEYDIISQIFFAYGYIYPFIEFSLGVCYLLRIEVTILNWITLVLMLISSIGVARALLKRQTLVCACLGTVFKIPMTYVTLFEDLLMAGMALLMLLF